MSNYHTKIQEVIQWQNIRQLVHFTRIANLRSIIEYGILSRQEIEKRKIKVELKLDLSFIIKWIFQIILKFISY